MATKRNWLTPDGYQVKEEGERNWTTPGGALVKHSLPASEVAPSVDLHVAAAPRTKPVTKIIRVTAY
jgi:hypothetical protein